MIISHKSCPAFLRWNWTILLCVLLVGCHRQLMPTPAIFRNSSQDLFAHEPVQQYQQQITVFYAKDRDREPLGFSNAYMAPNAATPWLWDDVVS